MEQIKTKCIVTWYTDYRDNDRMLSLFSAEKGRLDAKARSCRKATSPLLPAAQPFVYGEFVLFSSREKLTVDQCEVLESFYPLREDVERFAAASLACALCRGAVQEGEGNEALFSLLYHTLSFLAYGKSSPKDMTSCFLIRFLSLIGYRPAITHCALCGRDMRGDKVLHFDLEKGGALCHACAFTSKAVDPVLLEAMRRMLLLEEEQMDRVKFKETLGRQVLSLLLEYTLFYFPQVRKAAQLFEGL